MTMERKHTKFEVCDRHAGWRQEGRRRLAEFFCEGGDGNYCAGGLCRCHPGTDLYCAEISTGGELPYNWDRWPGESDGELWEPFAEVGRGPDVVEDIGYKFAGLTEQLRRAGV